MPYPSNSLIIENLNTGAYPNARRQSLLGVLQPENVKSQEGGRSWVLYQIFGTWVQHSKKNWTQLDLRFCEKRGQNVLKSMKKEVNWIEK